MAKRVPIEVQLARLRELEDELPSDATERELRLALDHDSNFVVEKAARIVREKEFADFEVALRTAFDRFLINPLKNDKGCRAKTAIVEALNFSEFDEPEFFTEYIKYQQLEPAMNGPEDTAVHLRGACAYGIASSQWMRTVPALNVLVDLLNDPCKTARAHAATAIANTGRDEAVPVLRLKVYMGDAKYEVIGACFEGLMSLDAANSVALIASQLQHRDIDIALEAAAVLGASRRPEAIAPLIRTWKQTHDQSLHQAILISLGLSK